MNGRIIKFEGSAHAEADRLLPWLVNGTLSGDERFRVEQHMTECVQCQREVTWLRALQEQYIGDQPATGDDQSPAIRRLRRRMETAHDISVMASPSHPAWKRRSRRLSWLVAAQATLLLVLGAALLQGRQASYHTLSAPPGRGALLVVVFDPHASEAQLRQLLRANDARIVGGPTDAGAYVLNVPDERASSARKMLHESAEVSLVENLETGANP
jgi:anti-sigma factor RsiW